MGRITQMLLPLTIAGLITLTGCGSSEQTSSSGEQKTEDNGMKEVTQKVDTAGASLKTPPAYDARTSTPGTTAPTGKFSVQIGAYKLQDNADHVASLAKERFGKNIYTILDPPSGLVKVYLGDFMVKDDARKFRDEMALKYPSDYKDAWVSENPQK